jgi:Flp pilus assembly protein TadB
VLAAGCAALALALGVPPPVVALSLLALWQPVWCGAGALAWAVYAFRRRRAVLPGPDAEADFLRGLAAELEAGASLRSGVVAAAQRVPSLGLGEAARLAAAGMPADRVGTCIGAALTVNGRLVAAAFRLAAVSGGRVAVLMHSLAVRAAEAGRLRREESAMTAQARASAWLVGGAPFLVLAGLFMTGRAGRLVSDPAGPVVLGIGLALEVLGVTAVWAMLRRARR